MLRARSVKGKVVAAGATGLNNHAGCSGKIAENNKKGRHDGRPEGMMLPWLQVGHNRVHIDSVDFPNPSDRLREFCIKRLVLRGHVRC